MGVKSGISSMASFTESLILSCGTLMSVYEYHASMHAGF